MTGLISKILTKLKMKKFSLEMLRLTSADVLERSQMKKITGGVGGTFYNCSCSGGPQFTVMTDGNPEEDAGCATDESAACIAA
jgi:hypothetical protein